MNLTTAFTVNGTGSRINKRTYDMTVDELLKTDELHHPTAFADAFFDYLIDREEATPANIRDQLKKCREFSIVEYWELIEMVYAHHEDCGPILKEMVGKMAEFYDARNYIGMRERGGPINSVLRASAGLPGAKMPSENNIPEIAEKYRPVEEAEAVAPEG